MAALGSRRVRTERGAAMVEFAILLPLFLLVIAGIVDFGRAFFTQIALSNAAREGARAAIVSTVTTTEIETRAASSAPGVAGLTITVLQSCPGTNAEVEASAAFQWIVLEPALNLVGGAGVLKSPLISTAVMKCGG